MEDKKLNFHQEEVKLVKLIFKFPHLRKIFLSLGIYQYLSDSLARIVKKILNINYFENLPIDLRFVQEKAESLGIPSIELSLLISDLESSKVEEKDFWLLVDKVKTSLFKNTLIPTLISEYEKIIKSDSEIEILQPLSKISDTISSLMGKQNISIKTEAELRDIRSRIKIYIGEKESEQKRFKTGYETMDKCTGGFATSELSTFMGASGSGKTTLLLNIAYQLWLNANANIMLFSLEMPLIQVLRRLDSRILNVDYDILKYGRLKTTDELEGIKLLESNPNIFKVIDIPPKTPPSKIEEYILSSSIKPDVVVVDYIGLIGAERGRHMEKWQILDEAAMSLKYIAKKYQISVITASQVTTEAQKRKDSYIDGYQLYDLAGARAIGDHSDLVLSMHYDDKLNIMMFSTPKYRDGAKFSFQMFVNKERCHIYEIKK